MTATADVPYIPTLFTRKDTPGRMAKDVFLLPAEDSPTFDADPSFFMQQALARAQWWLPQQKELLDVYNAMQSFLGFREPKSRSRNLPRSVQLDMAEIERRFEHRCGILIRIGQQEGIFTEPNKMAGRISVMLYLDTGRTRTTKLKEMGQFTTKELDALIIQCREAGSLSQDNLLRFAKGLPIKPPRKRKKVGPKAPVNRKPRLNADKIAISLAEQLEAAISTAELVNPEDLDPEVKKETLASIRETCNEILKEIHKW